MDLIVQLWWFWLVLAVFVSRYGHRIRLVRAFEAQIVSISIILLAVSAAVHAYHFYNYISTTP